MAVGRISEAAIRRMHRRTPVPPPYVRKATSLSVFWTVLAELRGNDRLEAWELSLFQWLKTVGKGIALVKTSTSSSNLKLLT